MGDGLIVLLTNGAYSDYGVDGLYRVPSIDWLKDKFAQWLKDHPGQSKPHRFSADGFVKWVTSHPECVEVAYEEVHLGAYGKAEECSLYVDQLMGKRHPDGGTT